MKGKFNARIGRGLTAALLVTIGSIGIAHAGWTDPASESGVSTPGYFSNFGPGSASSDIDLSKYEKLNLGSLASTIYVPKPGAQGPLRDSDLAAAASYWHDIDARLGPVGGRNTP